MAELTAVRQSALHGHLKPGHHGVASTGVVIREIRDLTLWQLAVWPDSIDEVAADAARQFGGDSVPGFGQAIGNSNAAILRVEPLKFWLYGAEARSEGSEQSMVLDLSHSRTHLRLSGEFAATVLNSFLPVDLRDNGYPLNTVASSAMHHVGVTLWRSDAGFELFIPRGFSLSVWELLFETSLQYGLLVES